MALVPIRKRARPCPDLDKYEEEIKMKYNLGWPLRKIVESTNADYGLNATESQYKGRLYGAWGCRKRVKAEEWVQIDRELAAREALGKAETQVVLGSGTCITQESLERGRRRHVTLTDRMFAVRGRPSSQATPTQSVCTPAAIEVCTPPDFSSLFDTITPTKWEIPPHILSRLPIFVSQAFINTIFQRQSPINGSIEISTAKSHPSLSLLRVIIFRLSNNLFQERDISELLDSVDELGYRSALKELLSFKTISIEAACSNIIKILYERLDGDLIVFIYGLYPDLIPSSYTCAQDIIADILGPLGLPPRDYCPEAIRQLKLYLLPTTSRFRVPEFTSSSKSITFTGLADSKRSALKLILEHIEIYKACPTSLPKSRLLIFLCDCFGDINLFFELWDSIKFPRTEIESLGTGESASVYMPLAVADSFSVRDLYRVGFQHGKAFPLLRAAVYNENNLSQKCLEVFYPDWWSQGHRSPLSFDTDNDGNFKDFRTQNALWEAAMDLSASYLVPARCLMPGSDENHPWMQQNLERGQPSWLPRFPGEENYTRLLLYIGIVRNDILDEVFKQLRGMYERMWPPGPSDRVQRCIQQEYNVFLFRVASGISVRGAGLSKTSDSLKSILEFIAGTFPFQFLGQPSFAQVLETIRRIINLANDVAREKILAHFGQQVFNWEGLEECPTSRDQVPVLIASLQEAGLNLDDSQYSCLMYHGKLSHRPDPTFTLHGERVLVTSKTALYLSFWRPSPWLFTLLLSHGATLLDTRRSLLLERHDGSTINEEFWAAAKKRDYGAISMLWDSRVLQLDPDGPRASIVQDIITAVSRNEITQALRLTSQGLQWGSFFTRRLGDALISQLNSQPGPSALDYVAKFLASVITTSPTREERELNLCCLYMVVLNGIIASNRTRVLEKFLEDPKIIRELTTGSHVDLFKEYLYCAAGKSLGCLRLLISVGLAPKELSEQASVLLDRAVYAGRLDTVVYLLTEFEGAGIYASCDEASPAAEKKRTISKAIDMAVRMGRIDFISLFLEFEPGCLIDALNAASRLEKHHIVRLVEDWEANRNHVGQGDLVTTSSGLRLEEIPELDILNENLLEIA
ncbi:hypothetical protein TWF718_005230 [Orbilia javanica]|uniref:Clr5 domain-containing protein n=1 Tax=Orbilia javanica TaxID=47235 RepID=A0AAN8NWK8_9PEZI